MPKYEVLSAEMTYRDTGLTTRQVLIQAGVLP